jgi:hypothetical protein
MSQVLTPRDTFRQWYEKINAIVTGQDFGSTGFYYDPSQDDGLTVSVLSGNVRSGSVVEVLPDSTFLLPASTISVLCVYKGISQPADFRLYTAGQLPEYDVIPLWEFITSDNSVVEYTDLRTAFVMSGSGTQQRGILFMDKTIDQDYTVDANKNALSVGPITVLEGVTVTVDGSSEWVVV